MNLSTALIPVPDEVSLLRLIANRWRTSLSDLQKGASIELHILEIESEIRNRRAAIEKNVLVREFDWLNDLAAAEAHHARCLIIAQTDLKSRDAWVGFWQLRLQKNHDLVAVLLVDGLRHALLAHGVVALTCLTLYMTAGTEKFRPVLLFAMFSAALGVAMLSFGLAILIEQVGSFTNRVASWLVGHRSWRSLLAIHRYSRRHFENRIKVVPPLIYLSLLWFGFYVVVCILLLANIG